VPAWSEYQMHDMLICSWSLPTDLDRRESFCVWALLSDLISIVPNIQSVSFESICIAWPSDLLLQNQLPLHVVWSTFRWLSGVPTSRARIGFADAGRASDSPGARRLRASTMYGRFWYRDVHLLCVGVYDSRGDHKVCQPVISACSCRKSISEILISSCSCSWRTSI
jgi:hypothetical protein